MNLNEKFTGTPDKNYNVVTSASIKTVLKLWLSKIAVSMRTKNVRIKKRFQI